MHLGCSWQWGAVCCLFYNSRCDSDDPLKSLLKQYWEPPSQSFLVIRSGIGPKICMFNKFPDNTEVAGLGSHSELLAYGKNMGFES